MWKEFIINKNTIKQKSRKIIIVIIITNIVYFSNIYREFCIYTQEWYTESYDNIKTAAK